MQLHHPTWEWGTFLGDSGPHNKGAYLGITRSLGQGGVVRRTGVVLFFQPPSLPAALLDLRRATRGEKRCQTYSIAYFFGFQPLIRIYRHLGQLWYTFVLLTKLKLYPI